MRTLQRSGLPAQFLRELVPTDVADDAVEELLVEPLSLLPRNHGGM